MRSSRAQHILNLAFVAALATASKAPAQVVVVPNSDATVEGDVANAFPFNITAASIFNGQRYQQVYASSQFGSIPTPTLITAIRFRPDGSFGGSFSQTLSDIRIDLSTTSKAVGGLSQTFASNLGLDDTIVFGGSGGAALALSSADTGGPPRNFDITINLTTPFLYNPLLGNLLLDVRNFNGGFTSSFDEDDTTNAISRIYTNNSGVNSATSDSINNVQGLVTQFTFGSVPEPGSLALVGVAAIVGWRRLCRQTARLA